MPDRIGRYFTDVGQRQPVIIFVSLSVMSSFPVWVLLHQAGAAYSAAL